LEFEENDEEVKARTSLELFFIEEASTKNLFQNYLTLKYLLIRSDYLNVSGFLIKLTFNFC